MSKLLIALLALDIGVSLSKVLFSWKSNYQVKKEAIVFQKKKYLLGILYLIYFIK